MSEGPLYGLRVGARGLPLTVDKELEFDVPLRHLELDPPRPGKGPNRLFQILDLYWRAPKSGGVWCTARRLKKTDWSRSEGWWYTC